MKIILLLLLTAVSVCHAQRSRKDEIFFASVNYSILKGQYDGVISIDSLKAYGDFGLGSEEKLASELVLIDGKSYGVPASGEAAVMSDNAKIAFAAVKFFRPERQVHASDLTDLDALQKFIDEKIDQNLFIAIRIDGVFNSIEFRSFVEQDKPYQPIDNVKENKFRYENIRGTMVGFFTPKSSQVLNSPNYHFHFIDDERKTGGHILNCNIKKATIALDYTKELHVLLPPRETVKDIDLNQPVQSKKGD